MSISQPMSCVLPADAPRARGLGQHPDGPVRCALPEATPRRAPIGAAAPETPAQVALPMEYHRQSARQPETPAQVAYPMEIARAQSRPATPPSPAAPARQPLNPAGDMPPAPRPDPELSLPAPAADQGRAKLSVAAMLPIVEITARGISGAAGYAYMGEDPDAAGLRFGMLGQRLDTGDMGRVLALAQTRDAVAFDATFGAQAQAILQTTQADTPEARKAAVDGLPLWEPRWKTRLSSAGSTPAFVAAQNEYAVEAQLRPAAQLVLAHPALVSGAALAMALDALAECGRDAGLEKLRAVLGAGPVENLPAFQAALAKAVPVSGRRLPYLARHELLLNWRPDVAQTGAP
ncbi:MAG: hypothetical protein AB8B82_04105 [Roseovarius sp.]